MRAFTSAPDADRAVDHVIGVVGNVRNDPARRGRRCPLPTVAPTGRSASVPDSHVGNPLASREQLRASPARIDPDLSDLQRGDDARGASDGFAVRRLPVVLMTAFGALALLLASVGVYAMFAAMAAAREREFGVRVALGSSGRDRRARPAAGRHLDGRWSRGRRRWGRAGSMLRNLLYGVQPFDPFTLTATVLMLFGVRIDRTARPRAARDAGGSDQRNAVGRTTIECEDQITSYAINTPTTLTIVSPARNR